VTRLPLVSVPRSVDSETTFMERWIKFFIWAYLILLIAEGALRKWFLPSLADPLLIIRDPVVLAIYFLAFATQKFPTNPWVLAVVALAIASFMASFIAGQTNMIVTLYGMRINYLHLPLIWVMGEVLDRKDVAQLGTALLLIAIPMTALMTVQFESPMNAFINCGVGNDEGGQIFGAAGRIRPPGTFAFITGPQMFYPLVAAIFLHQISEDRKLWWPVILASGLSLIVAAPISISRTVMLSCLAVFAVFLLTLPLTGSRSTAAILRGLFGLGAVAVGVSFIPIFHVAQDVFMERWQTAAESTDGNAWGGVAERVTGDVLDPFYWAADAPVFGYGIGVGSNVGGRLLSGEAGFMLAEDEWGKIFLELGPMLGGAFIGFRVVLTAYLGLTAFKALRETGDNLPILIFASCVTVVAQAQWAPPTIMGFAVFDAGLLIAAANHPLAEEDEEEPEGGLAEPSEA